MCPGQDASAGKRRSGRTTRGNRRRKRTSVQEAAWAASRAKGTYLQTKVRRLARWPGRQEALVAVGRTLLGIIDPKLKRGTRSHELGANFLGGPETERLRRQLVRRLKKLGHQVTLGPAPAA
jgi:hypothetical protein